MPLGIKNDTGIINDSRWDDLAVPAALTKIGSNSKPDFDYTNIGLLFPQNDVNEKAYLTYQMPHRKKLGTGIYLHVHFVQTGATKPTFGALTRFYNNGGLVPAYEGEILTSATLVFTWASGSLLNVASFPLIAAPANEDLSANLDVILYRKDNAVTGDVLVKYIDVHYEIDSDGSREERAK